jgi:hypothetical protein
MAAVKVNKQTNIFPHIESFDNIYKQLQKSYRGRQLPTIAFKGTVKVHGTHGAIIMSPYEKLHYQSRSNILEEDQDNFGFKKFMIEREIILIELFNRIKKYNITHEIEIPTIGIYGEFCGKGIQKRVAISNVEKFFIVFAVRIFYLDSKKNYWLNFNNLKHIKSDQHRIINIIDFPIFEVEIDFNDIDVAKILLFKYTKEVSDSCPIGKYFNSNGLGEGIVWHACKDDGVNSDSGFGFMFKTKTELFDVVNHKKLKEKDKLDIKTNEIITIFVKSYVTLNRLEQGILHITEQYQLTKENCKTKLKEFVQFMINDILREGKEFIDDNKLYPDHIEQIKKQIQYDSIIWYTQYVNNLFFNH